MKKIKLNVGFFVGSDITSHLILNFVVERLINEGHKIFVFFTYDRVNENILNELQELYFYERTLLNDYAYPYLDTKKLSSSLFYKTPNQLVENYKGKLFIQKIKNVNSKEFIHFLKMAKISLGISIRCYQKFSESIITYFSQAVGMHQPFFVNLHPGLLPQYRGVTTFCRSMQNNEKRAGFTLHLISTNWDAGPIISRRSQTLDYGLSVIENMCAQHELGGKMLIKNINKVAQGDLINVSPQSKNDAHYYTHPSISDLKDFKKKNIFIVRPEYIKKRIVSQFTLPKSVEERELSAILGRINYVENIQT